MQGKDPKTLIEIARSSGNTELAEPLDLGARVRELRKARDWTLEQAAGLAGLARSIRPVFAPVDGDTVFVLSTGSDAQGVDAVILTRLGELAAGCLARAVARGVWLTAQQSTG